MLKHTSVLAFWSFFRITRRCHSKHAWHRRQGRLGVDFHSGTSPSSVVFQIITNGNEQEGLFSVLMGIASFFLVPSTPRGSKFLTDSQKELRSSITITSFLQFWLWPNSIIERRLEKGRPFVKPADKFTPKEISRSLTSPHVILVFIIFFMLGTTLYGIGSFCLLSSTNSDLPLRERSFLVSDHSLLPSSVSIISPLRALQSHQKAISWNSCYYFRITIWSI